MADDISFNHRKWVAFKTVIHKEVVRFMRIWTQTILPSAITMALYFLIFGKFVGSQIGVIHGVTYIEFIMPGLVMMSVITNSYANVVSSFFGAKFQKNIEEMIVSPMPNWIMLLGYVGGGVLRGVIVGFVVMAVSLFFTHINIQHIGLTLLVVLLTAILFSIAGFVNAIYAKKFDDVAIVPTFVLTPLTYLGGVFYSIDRLDQPWQSLSQANPILYMVTAFRYGILGDKLEHVDVSVSIAIAVITVMIFVLYMVALHLLNRGTGIRT